MMAGIMRALAHSGSPAPVRVMQIARGMPRAAREFKGHHHRVLRGGPDADRPARAARVHAGPVRAPRRALGRQGPARSGQGARRSRCRCGSPRWPATPRSSACSAAPEFAARVVRERAGGAFDPAIATPLADAAAELLALDADASVWEETLACEPGPRLTLEGEAIDRALAAMGDFADLASPYLVGHSAGVAELATAAAQRCRLEAADLVQRPARRAGARSRAGGGPGPHLAEGGAAHAGRLGAGQAARLPLRARPRPLAVPCRARARRRLPPRASRRLGLPPRSRRRGDHAAGAPARRRRRLPRHDRAPAAPGGTLARTGRRGPRPGGRCRTAGPRRRHRGAGGGWAAGPTDRAAGGADRARGRGHRPARARPADQAGRASLGISVKTADHHIQNAYAKIGVSTRAAAALFAMQHGLTAWGELPIGRTRDRS